MDIHDFRMDIDDIGMDMDDIGLRAGRQAAPRSNLVAGPSVLLPRMATLVVWGFASLCKPPHGCTARLRHLFRVEALSQSLSANCTPWRIARLASSSPASSAPPMRCDRVPAAASSW